VPGVRYVRIGGKLVPKRSANLPPPPVMTYFSPEERQETYLMNLGYLGTVTGALETVGARNEQLAEWRRSVPGFLEREEEVRQAFADRLEAAAIQRAMKKSDLLMMFLLKGLRPEKYRENRSVEVSGPGGRPIEHHHIVRQLTDADLEARLAALEARERGALPAPAREAETEMDN